MAKTVTIQGQQKWDCFLVTRKTEPALLAECNRLGQEGWELINVLYYKDLKGIMCWTAFFKRPSTGEQPLPAPAAAGAAASQSAAGSETPAPDIEGFDLGDQDFELKPD
jgi:hypothetical protein